MKSSWKKLMEEIERFEEGSPFDNKAAQLSQATSYIDQMPSQQRVKSPAAQKKPAETTPLHNLGSAGEMDPDELEYVKMLFTGPISKKFPPSGQKTLASAYKKIVAKFPELQKAAQAKASAGKPADPMAHYKPVKEDAEGSTGEDDHMMAVQNGTLGAADVSEAWGKAAKGLAAAAGLAMGQPTGEVPMPKPKPQMAVSHVPFQDSIGQHIDKEAKAAGIPPILIHAMIAVESEGKSHAVSPKGATGLMQLMPATAASLGVKNIKDPHQNVSGGIAYMKKLLTHTKGNINRALAYYNFGPNAASKTPPKEWPEETKDYIRKVRAKIKELKAQEPKSTEMHTIPSH
jgi:soluble lytic murein transglycosylase-like protein